MLRKWVIYDDHINTCTKVQLLLGEGSSASLKGNFEPFLWYLAMRDTWRSATPSSCSLTPTLPAQPRAASAELRPCLTGVCVFLGFHALSQAHRTCFFTIPRGIITSLDLAIHNCIYRMRASGACRDFFSRSGERFQSIRPPSCPLAWLAPSRAACREHAGGGHCNVHQ